jgi:TolA-binding protein
MDCERANRENIAERYLAGTLDADAKAEWEEHYFACNNCAEQMELYQQVTPALREMAPQIRGEMRPHKPGRGWLWIAVPAAALIFIGVAIQVKGPQKPVTSAAPKTGDLSLFAKLDPPAYSAPTLRGLATPADRRFREAMTAYQSQDWPRAVDGLNTALQLDPNAAGPRFFLGASYLLEGDAQSALEPLGRVASGDSPFAEEARFDLAKAYLALNRKADAIAALQQCHGDFATQAAALLSRIAAVAK